MIKTRSQLTLPDFNYDVLGVSPLKQARTARTAFRSAESSTSNELDEDNEPREGEERDPKHPKRSSSCNNTDGLQDRAVKRVKRSPLSDGHEDGNEYEDGEAVRSSHVVINNKPLASSSNPFASRKPPSTVSLPPTDEDTGHRHADNAPRSQSAPVEHTLPSIGVHRIPRSPFKLQSKASRSPSVPPPDYLQKSLPHDTKTTNTADEDSDMTSVLPNPSRPTPLAISEQPPQPQRPSFEGSVPTSPLTPLPPTPAPRKGLLYQYHDTEIMMDAMNSSTIRTSARSTTPTQPRPRTPSTSSMIPRPAFPRDPPSVRDTPTTPKRGVVARMKPKGAKSTPGSTTRVSDTSAAQDATPTGPTNAVQRTKTLSPEHRVPQGGTPSLDSGVRKTLAPEVVMVVSESRTPNVDRAMKSATPGAGIGEVSSSKSVLLAGSVDMEVPLNDAAEEAETEETLKSIATDTAPSVVKSKKPLSHTDIPLGGRMTRSASLRQKENKKNIQTLASAMGGAHADRGSGSGPHAGTSHSGRSVARPKTPAPSGAVISSNTAVPPSTPGRKRAMTTSSVTRPTLSSAAKANPPTPGRSRPPASMVVTSSSRAGVSDASSRPASAMSTSSISRSQGSINLSRTQNNADGRADSATSAADRRTKHIPSLSTLSMALEKLNARRTPRPNSNIGLSRPSTSLGFSVDGRLHRGSDSDDEDNRDSGTKKSTTSGMSKAAGASKDDSHIKTVNGSGATPEVKPAPMKRAATVGPSAYIGLEPGEKKLSTLMLPPPVPKTHLARDISDGETAKRINLHSGIIAGKTRGRFTFGNSSGKPRFGVAPLPKMLNPSKAGRSRVIHRVSKESNLPTVEGSPAKPSGLDVVMTEANEQSEEAEAEANMMDRKWDVDVEAEGSARGKGKAQDPLPSPSQTFNIEAIRALVREEVEAEDAENAAQHGGSKSPDKWGQNASRRASAASHLLSQSMSTLPQTPPRKVPATEGKGKARATSSAYPQSSIGPQTAPDAFGRTKGIGARVSANTRGMAAAVAAADTTPSSSSLDVQGEPDMDSNSPMPAERRLKILKHCRIFVDVRTDAGDDAGGLFVDMLNKLGAKLLTRVGQSCTHIVFKNGLMSTLTRYRLLNDPKPFVVGIAWVVECAEQAKHADETKFLVNLDGVNVAGSNKRRRSMLPKHLIEFGTEPRALVSPVGSTKSNDNSVEVNSPSSDDATPNSSLDSDLPPLERARRRHSSLFSTWGR